MCTISESRCCKMYHLFATRHACGLTFLTVVCLCVFLSLPQQSNSRNETCIHPSIYILNTLQSRSVDQLCKCSCGVARKHEMMLPSQHAFGNFALCGRIEMVDIWCRSRNARRRKFVVDNCVVWTCINNRWTHTKKIHLIHLYLPNLGVAIKSMFTLFLHVLLL